MTNTVTDELGIQWLVDPETGELLEAAPTDFKIDSPESLAWLLGAERKTRCAQEADIRQTIKRLAKEIEE